MDKVINIIVTEKVNQDQLNQAVGIYYFAFRGENKSFNELQDFLRNLLCPIMLKSFLINQLCSIKRLGMI